MGITDITDFPSAIQRHPNQDSDSHFFVFLASFIFSAFYFCPWDTYLFPFCSSCLGTFIIDNCIRPFLLLSCNNLCQALYNYHIVSYLFINYVFIKHLSLIFMPNGINEQPLNFHNAQAVLCMGIILSKYNRTENHHTSNQGYAHMTTLSGFLHTTNSSLCCLANCTSSVNWVIWKRT